MACFMPVVGQNVEVIYSPTASGGDNTQQGVVRFVGATHFTSGIWVGLELYKGNGKNDGSIEGTRYFRCGKNRGLFVRPSNLKVLTKLTPKSKEDLEKLTEDLEKKAKGLQVDEYATTEHKMDVDGSDDALPVPYKDTNYWFSIEARAFLFIKSSEQWLELGVGDAEFYWSSLSNKVLICLKDKRTNGGSGTAERRMCVEHLFDPRTRLDPKVSTQQSWVFRAQRKSDPSAKDVLCLQFATHSLATEFVTNFESYYKSLSIDEDSGKDDLKTRKTKMDAAEQCTTGKTRIMRRRLTISGEDPNIDGNEVGARMEPRSPRPTSPRSAVDEMKQQFGAKFSKIQVKSFSGVSRKGLAPYNPDKRNRDSMIMQLMPVTRYTNNELMMCVFDGHGENGHHVSQHFAGRLTQSLASCAAFAEDSTLNQTVRDSVLRLENEIINNRSINTNLSGTTAVISVLRENKLFVSNIGDSRIIKGTVTPARGDKILAVDLSEDHKPELPKERARIQSRGGRVFAMKYSDGIDGPPRVWLPYADMPGLAMSRSLGDTIGKEAGVTSEPECFVHELVPGRDKFIIVATDGLWEFMSSQEVADIVSKYLHDADPRAAIEELVQESKARWLKEEPVVDDTTIIVAFLE